MNIFQARRTVGGLVFLFLLLVLTACESGSLPGPQAEQAAQPPPTQRPTATQEVPTVLPTPVVTPTKNAVATIAPTPTTSLNPISTLATHRLRDYKFSEPKRIMSGKSIRVVSWLPDSQGVLMLQRDVNQGKDTIEVVDLNGQQIKSFGTWHISPQAPVIFLPDTDEVVFIGYDEENNIPVLKNVDRNLSTKTLSAEVEFLAGLPNNPNFLIIDPQKKVVEASQLGPNLNSQVSLTPSLEITSVQDGGYNPPLAMVVNPTQPDQGIIFDRFNFLLVDLETDEMRSIDLGEEHSQRADGEYWALAAAWSPDGRWLATITAIGPPLLEFSNLTILDTSTWSYRRAEVSSLGVSEISWSPNSRDLLIRVQERLERGVTVASLHLVDTVSLESRPLSLFNDDLVDLTGRDMLWSPDGQKIIVQCTLLGEVDFEDTSKTAGQVCLIEVNS